MNSHELISFIKIVELGSFSLAAESLYISQSAISQQMKSLEQSVGFPLFDHSQHHVTLTAAGEKFYQRARQMLALYNESCEEGQYLSSLHARHIQRLEIGCLDDQIVRYWLDVIRLTENIEPQYAPRFVRYENRSALFSALLRGEADLTLQMESADIQNNRLRFIPLTTIREICHPFNFRLPLPSGSIISPEELYPYTIVFHNVAGYTIFEDSLRSYIRLNSPESKILEPRDFPTADYETPKVLLLPASQFTHQLDGWGYPLDFEGNIRIGFIISPNCRPAVLEYADYIKTYFMENGSPWEFSSSTHRTPA